MTRAERLALRCARDAELMDAFHITAEQIGGLTPRQIEEWHFHKRDQETGAIKRPTIGQAAPTPEQHIAAFMASARMMGVPEEQIAAKADAMRDYYTRKAAGEDVVPPKPAPKPPPAIRKTPPETGKPRRNRKPKE